MKVKKAKESDRNGGKTRANGRAFDSMENTPVCYHRDFKNSKTAASLYRYNKAGE